MKLAATALWMAAAGTAVGTGNVSLFRFSSVCRIEIAIWDRQSIVGCVRAGCRVLCCLGFNLNFVTLRPLSGTSKGKTLG